MRTRLPPNVHREKNRHGTVVYYYRLGKGSRVRLPEYGSPEFAAAYRAALVGDPVDHRRGVQTNREGSLAWMFEQYKLSSHWRNEINDRTRRLRNRIFSDMVAKSGDVQIRRITEQVIVDGRERRATSGKGHRAVAFLKAIKPAFAYAKTRGWIDFDPARNVEHVKTKTIGHRIWTVDEVKAFEERHPVGTMANLAMRIMLYTGLRRSDACLLGRQHCKGGILDYRPMKTAGSSGVSVSFPILPPLQAAIEATPHGDLTFLISDRGLPFASGASFGNWFRDRCVEAKVPGRAHGLRKAGATLAAESGASASELMAMWGWTTLAQAETYTRTANRKLLGRSASAKLMQSLTTEQNENTTPRTSDTGAGMGQKSQ